MIRSIFVFPLIAASAFGIEFSGQLVTAQVPVPSSCVAPMSGSSFQTSAGTVYLFFEASVTITDSLTSGWLAPDGTVVPGTEWTPDSGSFCFTGAGLPIGNLPPAQLGSWQAQVFDNGSPLFSVPFTVVAGAPSPTTAALPHFAVGGSFTTDYFIVNSSAQPQPFAINFYNDGGTPVSLPFSGIGNLSILSGTVPAFGVAYYEASGPQLALVSGWAQVSAGSAVTVLSLFREHAPDGNYYEASVASSLGGTQFEIPFDATTFADTGAPFYTGFAIANTDSAHGANLNCTARDTTGAIIPNAIAVPTLSPLGHYANYNFPALTGQRGSIICTSNTVVAAIALRFIGNGAFSSLPVITSSGAASDSAGMSHLRVPTAIGKP